MHARTYHYGFERTPERLNAAKAAADRSVDLDPRLAEAHIALAHYYYWGTREYDLALAELERARQIEPNNSEVWLTTAYVKRRQGAMEEAIQLLERDRQLSPRDPNVAVALGETFGTLRRYGEAEAAFRRGIELAPEDSYPHTELTLLELRRSGDPDAARARISEMPSVDSGEASRVRYLVALFDRDWEEALGVVANAPVTLFEAGSFYQPAALLEGLVHHLAGDDASARSRFLAARELLGQELQRNPEDHRIHAALGIAEAGLERRAEAINHAEQAVALYPISGDALGAPVQVVNLALVHALLGDGASAARHLREVLSIPSTMSTAWLRNDPRWDGVRSSDAFERLLIEFDPN